ncbi:DUF6370 family protein [uncultured Tenacibaculum sp.]|uniref:DUF6370 family protein n=1 Tax=uncultured Tenacibaculum sp. TaxID=174713 RepID=UPI00260189E6|nr:DUF6370 family protein [uncultured Tenacibaculum sp.]
MKNTIFLIFIFGIIACSKPQYKEQIVETSCGQCKFNLKTQMGCDLAVKIDDKAYFVDGAHIDDYGDAHDKKIGFCNVVRKAKVTGTIENNTFKVTSFEVIE